MASAVAIARTASSPTMASSVFYRFKSQKEPSRITFDGTGISVFELKRAIIEMSNLGDGMDFELTLTSSDGGEGKFRHRNLKSGSR